MGVQVGCLAYELLTGHTPFEFPNEQATAAAILFGQITAWPEDISTRGIHFLQQCLCKVRTGPRLCDRC